MTVLAGESNINQISPIIKIGVFLRSCARCLFHFWNHVCILCIVVLILLLIYIVSLMLLALLAGSVAGVICVDGRWCWLYMLVHVLMALSVHVLVVSCFVDSGLALVHVLLGAGLGGVGCWCCLLYSCYCGADSTAIANDIVTITSNQIINDTSSSHNPNMLWC